MINATKKMQLQNIKDIKEPKGIFFNYSSDIEHYNNLLNSANKNNEILNKITKLLPVYDPKTNGSNLETSGGKRKSRNKKNTRKLNKYLKKDTKKKSRKPSRKSSRKTNRRR